MQRVVDGDTLRLERWPAALRMIGLNTPELGKQGRGDEPFAVAARKRLEALVAASDGRVGVLPGKESRDDYGRTLAHVYSAKGANLEERSCLPRGWGFWWRVAPNVDLVDCQQSAERQCAEAGPSVAAVARRGAEQISAPGFAVLTRACGKVQRNRGGVWIELQGSVVLRVAPSV